MFSANFWWIGLELPFICNSLEASPLVVYHHTQELLKKQSVFLNTSPKGIHPSPAFTPKVCLLCVLYNLDLPSSLAPVCHGYFFKPAGGRGILIHVKFCRSKESWTRMWIINHSWGDLKNLANIIVCVIFFLLFPTDYVESGWRWRSFTNLGEYLVSTLWGKSETLEVQLGDTRIRENPSRSKGTPSMPPNHARS